MYGFYDRLPIADSTKEALGATAEIFEELAAIDDLAKQEELAEEIQQKERKLLEGDPAYLKVKGYIAEIMSERAGDNAQSDADSEKAGSSFAQFGEILDGNPSDVHEASSSLTVSDDEEDEINRVGDVIFKESSAGHRGTFTPTYTMKWGHIALYSGDGRIYDAHPDRCRGRSRNGVALRSLSRMYENADSVMYAQLDNQSWRWSQARALGDAEDAYGTNCSTPFTRNAFAMSGTSKFFCSKLVWRVYLDNENYSVDVNSNAVAYHQWLQEVWPEWLAGIIIINTVAPDEIALSPHLDDYRTLE